MRMDCRDICMSPTQPAVASEVYSHIISIAGRQHRIGFLAFVRRVDSGKSRALESICKECFLRFLKSTAEHGGFVPLGDLFPGDTENTTVVVAMPTAQELDDAFNSEVAA